MDSTHLASLFTDTVRVLSDCSEMQEKGFFHAYRDSDPMPSAKALDEIVALCRSVFFPGFYGKSCINMHTLPYTIGVSVERLYNLLVQQIAAGLCFMTPTGEGESNAPFYKKAESISAHVIRRWPDIRKILETDVIAAYNGDPAAENISEIIISYPVIKTLTNYRLAHELFLLDVPLIPRMLTEMAHSETGIDIHPGAQIGRYFTIDHGTGVVIGATCVIGNHVKLYQGVTLGARSFPLDEAGHPIKGIPRHPILEDNVIVYSNATILGRITIGKGTVIGGNVWVTEDTEPGSVIVQARRKKDNGFSRLSSSISRMSGKDKNTTTSE